jgi:arsenite-transporting ATPase
VRFDRVVLDTAPTGHTLRMLQLPIFLQKLIQKVKRIQGSTGSGGGGGGSRLSDFERKMSRLEAILHSPKECEFTAVTIPTELASSETLRLLEALNMEGILVRRLIVNQVLPSSSDTSGEGGASGVSSYLERVRVGQARSMKELRSLSSAAGINLVQVPYFDMEIRTVYGVRVISKIIFANAP